MSLALVLLSALPFCLGQEEPLAPKWRKPPAALEAVALAAPLTTVEYAPNGRFALLIEREALPPLARLARPMEQLAGLRIDPATRARFTTDRATSLVLRPLAVDIERRDDVALELPTGGRITSWTWSLDGRRLALVHERESGAALLIASPEERGGVLVVATERLHPLFIDPIWLPDSDALLVALVPDSDAVPARPKLPDGPTVFETTGVRSPLRTFQDLLRDSADAARFGALTKCELAFVPAGGGATVALPGLGADLWVRASFAPDGRRLLTTRLAAPFSLRQPWSAFPSIIEVHGFDGDTPATHRTIAELPLAQEVPIDGVRMGPREVTWLPGAPSSLVWVEALDGGDPRRESAYRDRWSRLDLGLDLGGAPRTFVEVVQRARGLHFFADEPDRVVVTEYDRDRRWTRASLVDVLGRHTPVVLEDRSVGDAYGDPGALVTVLDERGQTVLLRDGEWVYRRGAGATSDGDRPFLACQSLTTGERREVWRSGTDEYARVVALFGVGRGGDAAEVPRAAVRRESAVDPPRDELVPLVSPVRGQGEGLAREVFSATDPQPELRRAKKELLRYQRADGVELSGVLYLPPDYAGDGALPLLIWAYPREFTDARVAGQVRGSAQRFTLATGASHLSLVLAGFAVLDGAAMPILGDPETMNDTFVTQLVAGAAAAIDVCVARGVAVRDKVAVGGHSYGAFMTANLLAHSDLFAAGIARSGAYNRTLTPFGFQAERRTLWEATSTYVALSPLLHAGGIAEPLLLIHGQRDSNAGTYPEQSERLFGALQGLGGTARLVLLPFEDHGYRSREAVLHVLAETHDWLRKHL